MEHNDQPRILLAVKTSFRNEGEIKAFLEKGKLRAFTASRSALKEFLKEVLQTEDKL